MNNFDLFSNLHLIFFTIFFLVVFVLFHFAVISLILAKGNPEKILKGRKILKSAFISLSVFLFTLLIFYSVSYFIKKGEVLEPSEDSLKNLPQLSYQRTSFPEPPNFIEIGKYYFSGPVPLEGNEKLKKESIFAVLCQKDNDYAILYIGDGQSGLNLLKHYQYNCWLSSCFNSKKSLYLAVIPFASDDSLTIGESKKDIMRKEIIKNTNPVCFD
ncbi:MAG: hypothetical protein PHI53_00290 [Candidatus Pacebacteria bacterium]|nr:hypothetical protein [Candidatus Paceibacterota bacterium]